MLAFSLPMLMGSVVQTAYGLINMFWVGRFLGKAAMAAATNSFAVFFALISFGAGLTLAANILVSQRYGARDMDGVRKVVDSSFVMVEVTSITMVIVGEIFAPQVLRMMNTPKDVLPIASQYLRVFLLGLPFGFGLFLIRSLLQGIGDSKTPMFALSASLALNAALDPVLMLGRFGFPRLGLNGTAWASAFAQLVALTWLLIFLRQRSSLVSPAWGHRQLDRESAMDNMRIGLPPAMQQFLISIGMIFLLTIVGKFGETALAGFGVASRIDGLAFMPAMTFSMAIATLAGQNIGAGRHHRVREVFVWGSALSCGVTIAVSLLVVLAPGMLLRVFTDDREVISIGVHYLRIVGSCYVLFAMMFVTNGIINGAGHTLMTTIITLVSLWVVRVPLAYLLSGRMGDVTGVWYAMSISFAVSMAMSLAYYLSGRWRRPVAGRAPMPLEPSAE